MQEATQSSPKISRATSVSPWKIYNSPNKKQLREELRRTKEQYNLRIKTLTQKTRRMKKKIASLKNVLETIKRKNFLQEEQLYNLKGISIGNVHLLKRVMYKSKEKSLSQKYSPQLRTFALTLHYYSPRAYSFVRESFNSCLPHPKTLYKWYCSVNGEPGFNKEAFAFIKKCVNKTDCSLFGALIMDEMAIRQQIEFDGQKFCGKCEMGDNIASEDQSIAKEALVFLVVGINKMWKMPVGYFLINSITGEQKANLVVQCLSLLHNTGICIKSLTCDGAANNFSMIRLLKCNIINPKCMQGYFQHPISNYKVHIFLDACHMLKLLRNTLGDYKYIVNSKGQMIKWDYIVALHELQQNEGLHLGNKLRQQHIQYHKKKMNVRFAAQVCSASVANALKMCRSVLQLDKFRNSEATEEFLNMINDLFDIFNSRNLRQKFYKCPINHDNSHVIFNKLEECKEYLLTLRLVDGQLLVNSNRKTGFLGFLINIENLKVLYQDVCQSESLLPYIPLYQLSQDHLELFFGCIRAFGGQNNNPSARLFKTAFKRVLVRAEIKNTTTGNCLELSHVPILTTSKPEEVINITSSVSRMIDYECEYNKYINTNNTILEIDHPYILPVNNLTLSEYSQEIIIYIAGFIVRYFTKHIICEICVESLTDNNKTGTLIHLKDRGSLLYPSQSVVNICKETEKVIRFYIKEQHAIISNTYNANYIAYCVLRNLNMNNIFTDLITHSNDQNVLTCHRVQLVKSIILKYVKTRYFYIGKTTNIAISKRHYYNKLILFAGK